MVRITPPVFAFRSPPRLHPMMILGLDCDWSKDLQTVLQSECWSYVASRGKDGLELNITAKNTEKLLLQLEQFGHLWHSQSLEKDTELIDQNNCADHEKRILDILSQNNKQDKIYWFADGTGKFKLGAFAKYLRESQGIVKIPTDSCKSMFAHVVKHCGKPAYLFDMTHSSPSDACLEALEMIKIGHFVLGGAEIVMPSPEIIVFSTSVPNFAESVLQCTWDVTCLSERQVLEPKKKRKF